MTPDAMTPDGRPPDGRPPDGRPPDGRPPDGVTLVLRDVVKEYAGRKVLDGIGLEVPRGDFLCIVGASGSGKSTLLSMIAGLEPVTGGTIELDGVPVRGPGPERGLVFQSGALFPFLTVAGNVGFGLRLLPLSPPERRRRVEWYLSEVGLLPLANSLPKELSGGQRQRVAIARALACEPSVLLLDEPFGALDVQTKEDMQVFLHQVWQDTGATVLMVTHDVEEAVLLGRRVIVLTSDPGRVAAELPVPLADHRRLGLKRTPQFLALRAHVEDLVRGRARSGA
ncbi:ABC transporter ATP-binding protein [Nonomuraea sp. NPDC002799]